MLRRGRVLLVAAVLSVLVPGWPLVGGSLSGAGETPRRLPTVSHEGRPYVELARVARHVGARPEVSAVSTRAHLRTAEHVVTLTRNRAEVLVDGKPVALGAPVRVRDGVWLVPEAFVERVLPRIASKPAPAPAPPPAPARGPAESPPAGPARAAPAAGTIALAELRLRSYASYTRVVIETSAPVPHRFEPTAGREVRVRLGGLAAATRVERVDDGLVDEVRLERTGADGLLRVILAAATAPPRVITLGEPPRLVLDFPRPQEETPREPGETGAPLRTIVLDAGHGGHDPGAIGVSGLMEKDVVLDVTRRVARLAEAELGLRVLLSRSGDHFVPLRDRTTFANRERADLFVSIHANSHPQAASEGVETFFLSSEATDGHARRVAEKENSVVELEKPASRSRDGSLKALLWDLAQSSYQEESSRIAEVVQDSMTRSLRIPNRGVKQAGFYVLGGAAMPAILIEIGFVTNAREERRLRSDTYRDEIARAILAGLAEYKRHWDRRMRTTTPLPTARTHGPS